MSKKLEGEKPGNLLVSLVTKVIKEEQSDSSMEVETDNKEGFKDIMKAADDFCLKGRFWKRSRQRQNPQGQREKKFPQKKKHRRSKATAREISRVIPREKKESPHSQTKQMERVQKRGIPPGQDRWEEYRKRWKENTQEKVVRKEKNNGGKSGGRAKMGQKLPSVMSNASL